MINWIKQKLGITALETRVAELQKANERLYQELREVKTVSDNASRIVEEHTRIDADIDIRGGSWVVVSGVWRGKGYVRSYRIDDQSVDGVKQYLDHIGRGYGKGQIDVAPQLRGWFEW